SVPPVQARVLFRLGRDYSALSSYDTVELRDNAKRREQSWFETEVLKRKLDPSEMSTYLGLVDRALPPVVPLTAEELNHQVFPSWCTLKRTYGQSFNTDALREHAKRCEEIYFCERLTAPLQDHDFQTFQRYLEKVLPPVIPYHQAVPTKPL